MGKRFTDTDIWEKQWFRELSPVEKAAFFYVKDRCDCAGVWNPDFKHANYCIGGEIDWHDMVNKVNGNIEILSNGKWWFPDFCAFQYKRLSEKCPPHHKAIELLHKHGLFAKVTSTYGKGMPLGIGIGYANLQEEEEEEEEEKEGEEEKEAMRRAEELKRKFKGCR